jgi:hypothetical protein
LREVSDDLSAIQDDTSLIELLDHPEIMSRNHNRHPRGIRLKEEIEHPPAHLVVKVSRRLVGKN